MDGLEHVARCVAFSGLAGDLWIDGSFITEKIDPKDADYYSNRGNAWQLKGEHDRAMRGSAGQ